MDEWIICAVILSSIHFFDFDKVEERMSQTLSVAKRVEIHFIRPKV